MRIINYKCDYCEKAVEDFCSEKGWIHIDECNLKIADGRTEFESPIINRFTELISVPIEFKGGLDFCSLACFVKWLFLSKDTDYRKDYDKISFLKEAIRLLVNDKDLKEIITDCLKLENL